MKRRSSKRASGRSSPYIFLATLCVILFTVVSKMAEPHLAADKPPVPAVAQETGLTVVHVSDGDTFKLSNQEKVRLIGIDTPELHDNAKLYRDAERSGQDIETIKRMGSAAYRFTRDLVEGQSVRLEFDVQQRDRYGRLLAYVYLADGTFVNARVIKSGYAYPMTIQPNTRHAEEFNALFREARQARVGLWADQQQVRDRHESSR